MPPLQNGHHLEGRRMIPLNHDTDWPTLGKQANWTASGLAKLCGVSVRTLERHFKSSVGKRPKKWLNEQRQRQAAVLLQNGCSPKETAAHLGYKGAAHFSSEFKKHWGYSAAQLQKDGSNALNCRVSA